MVKNRIVLKKCPKCSCSAALASKRCDNENCGYSFYDAKRNQTRTSEFTEEQPRRTKRVRRENPKFSSSEYEVDDAKEKEKVRQERLKSDPQAISPRKTSEKTKESIEDRLKRLREMKNRRQDMCGHLSIEKQALAAVLLSEINRKFVSVAWKL